MSEADRALAETKQAQAKTVAALNESQEARSQAEAVGRFLVEAFRSQAPDRDDEKVSVAAVLDQAAAKLGDQFIGSARVKGALLDAMGQMYRGLRLDDKAIQCLERAAAVRRDAMGADHPDTRRSRDTLADVYEEHAALGRRRAEPAAPPWTTLAARSGPMVRPRITPSPRWGRTSSTRGSSPRPSRSCANAWTSAATTIPTTGCNS